MLFLFSNSRKKEDRRNEQFSVGVTGEGSRRDHSCCGRGV